MCLTVSVVFETELMGIDGVKAEPVPARPTVAQPVETPDVDESPPDLPTSTPSPTKFDLATPTASASEPTKSAIAQGTPLDDEGGSGECNLLGDFALIVQGALGLLAVSSLAVKRLRESPRRPLKIWFFDVSKQVFGSVLLHLANILMSMLSSGKFDVAATTTATTQYAGTDEKGDQPNPCSFYLLNLAIDVGPTLIPLHFTELTHLDYNRNTNPCPSTQNLPQRLRPYTPRQPP